MKFLRILTFTFLAFFASSDHLFGQLFVQGNWIAIVTNSFTNNLSVIPSNQDPSNINSSFRFPYGVAISPDGLSAYVVSANDNVVFRVDIATNRIIDTVQVGAIPNFIAINSSGTRAYVTNKGDGTISILKLTGSLSVVGTFASDGKSASASSLPTGIAISSDDTTLYVVNQGLVPVLPRLTSFDLQNNRDFPVAASSVVLSAIVPNYITVTSQAATVQKLYLTDQNSVNPKATVYSYLLTNPLRPSFQAAINIAPSFPAGMALSSDGTRLYAVGQNIVTDEAISIIDTQANQVVDRVTFNSSVNLSDVKVSPDGNTLLVTDRQNSGVHVIDLSTSPPQEVNFITTGTNPLGIAIIAQ